MTTGESDGIAEFCTHNCFRLSRIDIHGHNHKLSDAKMYLGSMFTIDDYTSHTLITNADGVLFLELITAAVMFVAELV